MIGVTWNALLLGEKFLLVLLHLHLWRNFQLDPGQLEVVLDRRLMQDDNRGLGTGVTDNKVTPSNFRLVVERSGGTQEVTDAVILLWIIKVYLRERVDLNQTQN